MSDHVTEAATSASESAKREPLPGAAENTGADES